MKAAFIFACLVVMVAVYTVNTQHVACTNNSDCTGDCHAGHGHMVATNVCHHGSCHCHSVHMCTDVMDCTCMDGFMAACEHGHCHCHHQQP